MPFFSKLFGGSKSKAEPQAETYKDYRITPMPVSDGNVFRVSALIEKDFGGETRSHKLMRADTLQGLEEAQAASIRKAKQVIDEQGDRIFS